MKYVFWGMMCLFAGGLEAMEYAVQLEAGLCSEGESHA